MDNQESLDKIADAIWWLKGFAAGEPSSDIAESSDASRLARELTEVRIFLKTDVGVCEALEHAEAILYHSRDTITNNNGAGPSTSTRLALSKVRVALARARGGP